MIVIIDKEYVEDYIGIFIFEEKFSDGIYYDSEWTLNCPFLISIESIFSDTSLFKFIIK